MCVMKNQLLTDHVTALRVSMVILTNFVVNLIIPKITHESNDTLYLCGIHTRENMFSWLNKVCHVHQVSSKYASALREDNCIKAEPI
jgi:hypothetical protein